MFYKLYKATLAAVIIAGLFFCTVKAATILFPVGGGTGTNVAPTYGQVPVGVGDGTYTPQATSTLGLQTPISLTTTGSSGASTLIGNILNIPQYAGQTYTAGTGLTLTTGTFSVNTSQNIATLSNLTSNGIVTTSGGTGALSITGTNGSGNVVLTTSPSLTTPALGTPSALVGTNITGTGASFTAGNATKLTTGRTLGVTGDLVWTSPSFDGSGNVTAAGTLATVNSNVGSFTNANITVNAKGLVTAAANGSSVANTDKFATSTGDSTAIHTNTALKLGIGATSTPYASLSIDAPAQTNPYFAIGSSTSEVMRISQSPTPFFGIGTSTPGVQLDNFSTGTSSIRLDSNSLTRGGCIILKDSDGSGYTYITANNGILSASTIACN